MSADDLNRLLNGARAVVGAAALVAPGRVFSGAGVNARANPQLALVTRMFGVRDLALGVAALGAQRDERQRWLQATIAADAGDILAVVLAHRGGYIPTSGAIMLGLTAATGTALGIAALVADD